jgi:hypothetical protein
MCFFTYSVLSDCYWLLCVFCSFCVLITHFMFVFLFCMFLLSLLCVLLFSYCLAYCFFHLIRIVVSFIFVQVY